MTDRELLENILTAEVMILANSFRAEAAKENPKAKLEEFIPNVIRGIQSNRPKILEVLSLLKA